MSTMDLAMDIVEDVPYYKDYQVYLIMNERDWEILIFLDQHHQRYRSIIMFHICIYPHRSR